MQDAKRNLNPEALDEYLDSPLRETLGSVVWLGDIVEVKQLVEE
jgi:hypothetical protein